MESNLTETKKLGSDCDTFPGPSAPSESVPAVGSTHNLVIGPALQIFLESEPCHPSEQIKRIIYALGALPDPSSFLHEQFGALYFGHADPGSADILQVLILLQSTLNLHGMVIQNGACACVLQGLNIIKRVPDEDIKTHLESSCLLPGT